MAVMIVLFPNPSNLTTCRYNICFELDHSSCHAKDRIDGLSAVPTILNLNYGGTQQRMRDAEITAGCLGDIQHKQKSKVGDVQKMVFQETDAPPITDKDCPKFNEPTGVFEEKSLTVPELQEILERNQLKSDGN